MRMRGLFAAAVMVAAGLPLSPAARAEHCVGIGVVGGTDVGGARVGIDLGGVGCTPTPLHGAHLVLSDSTHLWVTVSYERVDGSGPAPTGQLTATEWWSGISTCAQASLEFFPNDVAGQWESQSVELLPPGCRPDRVTAGVDGVTVAYRSLEDVLCTDPPPHYGCIG